MKNYFKALANFQHQCPIIRKKTSGYGYKYADLPEIQSTVLPLLHKVGLTYSQGLDTNPKTNNNAVVTTIFHIESGEFKETYFDIPQADLKGQNVYQSLGSGITYLRRYSLGAALGIVIDEDNDASEKRAKVNTKANINF